MFEMKSNLKTTDGLTLITGSTGKGLSHSLRMFTVPPKSAAFRSWNQKLKHSDQRPRGKFFISRLGMTTRNLKTVSLEEPVEHFIPLIK